MKGKTVIGRIKIRISASAETRITFFTCVLPVKRVDF